MTSYTLIVKGMTCGGCEAAITSALRKVEGVREVKADHLAGRVVVEGDGMELDALRVAVEDAGYDWGGVA
jgi:copper chaperone CopZ